MLTAAAAICLVTALAIDVSHAGNLTASALWCTAAGIVLLLFGAVFPRWPRRSDDHSRAQVPTCEDAGDGSGNRRSDVGDEETPGPEPHTPDLGLWRSGGWTAAYPASSPASS